ncbi:Cyclophilin-type peptidylprolyl cis-trans isomerase [Penicillium ucsense]|uniref:Peptidyl-prolyl cis-trans isomerase n=1 Tax=Penicillium ucsense TaxID=2839758 RepID=A0A8J8VY92_9EURO|nr:Cyclophilin-type peptidylprolyl cis-trans isomerase [Penicillium ucsense]KAF7733352.1 Cyclophilin-type peptidylprolyl cis-trans isomerase [Penicillium ucsense]
MSALLETSLGDIVIDLLVDESPKACENFLKLCKIKYYNFAPIHSVQKDFSFQTGDPLGPDAPGSDGGSSIWGVLDGPAKRTFPIEIPPKMKHTERGTVSMATVPSPNDPDQRVAGSQFLITLGENLDYLDGKAAIFGKVVEGFDVLEKINGAFVDDRGRPLKDIRIRHTVVLDDPFDDPTGFVEPPESPLPTKAQLDTVRIADDEDLDEEMDEEAMEKLRREREARAQALTLEMVGDLPFADVKPPENVLFVCKLNPVTQDEDLQLIFSRFGTILSCEVIRDKRTGDSLQYAFVEFENQKDCEQAYFKMQGVLIDDHRIHVDFSQSVSKLSDTWRNATVAKRQQRGGFGGVADLEQKRQYRVSDDTQAKNGDRAYNMVFDRSRPNRGAPPPSGGAPRSNRRSSRSPRRDSHRDRRSSRSPRGRDSHQSHYRRRDSSRSPGRRDFDRRDRDHDRERSDRGNERRHRDDRRDADRPRRDDRYERRR